MSRQWTTTAHSERCRAVVEHAEFFADEASDAGVLDDAGHLRGRAARLAQIVDDSDELFAEAGRAHAELQRARATVQRTSRRLCLAIEGRLSFEESAAHMTTVRLAADSATRFRLQRLDEAQQRALGGVVPDSAAALRRHDDAERRLFDAGAAAHASRARCIALSHELRADCERVKARLLVTVEADSDAWRRISRRVVRTRRPDGYFARKLRE
jgi:hypothetical protein